MNLKKEESPSVNRYDPTGPASGTYRVLRGGSHSMSSPYEKTRSACRDRFYPNQKEGANNGNYDSISFRLVRP